MSEAERFNAGLAIIREAGELALGYFNNRAALSVTSKGLQDVVSEADVETEKLIRSRLEELFPSDAFMGEETGRSDFAEEQGIWVVDPIDGTQPFVSGLRTWCVSMAYVRNGAVRFGMVFAPALGELYAGGKAFPATLNGLAITPRHVASIRDGIVGTGYSPKSGVDQFLPPFERLLRAGGTFSRNGSGALALCTVATGGLVGYFELLINSWDCLGAIAVIHAAGLKTNDFFARDGLWKGNWLIAGGPAVYEELRVITGFK
jgi:myo-inositol-1(or 4)-monophosphatase